MAPMNSDRKKLSPGAAWAAVAAGLQVRTGDRLDGRQTFLASAVVAQFPVLNVMKRWVEGSGKTLVPARLGQMLIAGEAFGHSSGSQKSQVDSGFADDRTRVPTVTGDHIEIEVQVFELPDDSGSPAQQKTERIQFSVDMHLNGPLRFN